MAASLASPAFAAPRHWTPPTHPAVSYGEPVGNTHYNRSSDVVTFGGRVIGEDPDANIRTQLLFDPSVADD
jgi:hypothetical protein